MELITTDSFLYPNAVLEPRASCTARASRRATTGRALVRFVAEVKAGRPRCTAPVYSHLEYDIVPGATQIVNSPDILIVEGLNVLQPAPPTALAVNDYFDFSIYVDAKVEHIRDWYVDRFHKLRRTAFEDPKSYFKYLAELSDEEATAFAEQRVARHQRAQPRGEHRPHPGPGRPGACTRAPNHSIQRVRLRRTEPVREQVGRPACPRTPDRRCGSEPHPRRDQPGTCRCGHSSGSSPDPGLRCDFQGRSAQESSPAQG